MTHALSLLPRLLKSWENEAVVYAVASVDARYLKTLTPYQTCRNHPTDTLSEVAAALATRLRSKHTATQRTARKAFNRLRNIGLPGPA